MFFSLLLQKKHSIEWHWSGSWSIWRIFGTLSILLRLLEEVCRLWKKKRQQKKVWRGMFIFLMYFEMFHFLIYEKILQENKILTYRRKRRDFKLDWCLFSISILRCFSLLANITSIYVYRIEFHPFYCHFENRQST